MAFDRFLIAPINSGLQNNLRTWLTPDDSFEQLQNAYVFRGRVRKRFGSQFMGISQYTSRLRVQVGTIGAPTSPVPGSIFAVGQMFTAGAQTFIVINPAAGAQAMLASGPGTGTFNITNGAFVLAGTGLGGGTPIFWYPGQPVMGLTQYESGAINNHPSYAFDTQFAYLFTPNVGWSRSGTVLWHNPGGSTLNFFWATNWKGLTANIPAMFVTNFQVTNPNGAVVGATDDPIYVTQDGANWTNYSALTIFQTGGNIVSTARIILPFKNRLIFLNTIETDAAGANNSAFPNRCRYSHNGSPFAVNAWLEPNQTTGGLLADGAGFVDATTDEAIISAEFIKDRLIVYFERSTYELAYTGNEILPFIWQKLNTELGSQSLLSTVPFDQQVLTIGNTGVHSCNGSNVQRIDEKIPDEIFDLKVENNDTKRICGIRDYENEMVYWAVPFDNSTPTQLFPNQVLVYNYRNSTWAFNDDTFTAFGYFEQQTDTTWNSTQLTWAQANFTWQSGVIQAQQRQILAGNQEGFVLILDADISRNSPSLQITQITIPSAVLGAEYVDIQVINHNLTGQSFVAIENTIGINLPIRTIYKVFKIIDKDNFTIYAPDISGIYLGNGTLATVSNPQIKSKQWNPYDKDGSNVYLAKIDFAVQRTELGEVTVDYFPSAADNLSMITAGQATHSIMGDNTLETKPYPVNLYPLEQEQQRLWHSVYFQVVGECIQIYIFMTDTQLTTPAIAWSDLEIEGLILYTSRTGRLQ